MNYRNNRFVDRLKRASGFHWLHLVYTFFLIALCYAKKDLNLQISESILGNCLNKANNVLGEIDEINAITTILLGVCSWVFVSCIKQGTFSLFRLCSFAWIFWETTVNDDWLDVPSTFSPITYKEVIIVTSALCAILEIVHFIEAYQRINIHKGRISNVVLPFLNDAPTKEDELDRTHYAQMLIDKIDQSFYCRQLEKAAFNILINEEYGYGKSSFLNTVGQVVGDKAIIVEYKPWLCDTPEQLAKEYFKVIREQVAKFDANADGLFATYLRSLSSIENEWTSWLKPFAKTSIWKTNNTLTQVMAKLPKPIIVLIDDADRMQYEELSALLRLLRNSADFPNVVHIVAAQKSSLEEQLNKEGIVYPESFLKKFFNYEMLLPANDNLLQCIIDRDIKSLLSNGYGDVIDKAIADIRQIPYFYKSFENVRDWKRYYNILTFSFDVLRKEENDQEIFIADVFALALIQHIRPDVYKQLRNQDNPLLVISKNSDKVFVLAKDIRDLIERKEPHNLVREVIASRNQTVAEKQEAEEKEREEKAKYIHCINDFLKQEDISNDLIVCKLLEYLFPATVNVGPKNRITYCDSFFRYFSGKLKKNQLSNREAIYIFTKADDSEYLTKVGELINKDKEESILHKIYFILENRNTYLIDRLNFLQRVLSFIDTLASKYVSADCTKTKALSIVFERYQLLYLFLSLYHQRGKNDTMSNDEQSALRNFIKNDKRYALILLLLNSLGNYMYEDSLITRDFCVDLLKEVWSGIVSNIINKDCFSDEAIDTYQICIDMHTNVIKDLLYQYIAESNDHLSWLFKCCKQYDDKSVIYWNGRFKYALIPFVGDGEELADLMLLKYPEESELINDFKKLIRIPELKQVNINDHIFLKEYLSSEYAFKEE